MKRKLSSLLLAAIAAFSLSVDAFAQLSTGDYVLQNVEAGTYLGGANSWGTQASLVSHGQLFTITQSGTSYTLDSHTYNAAASHFLTNGLYVDGVSTNWTISAVDAGNDIYTLTYDGTHYLASASGSTVLTTVTDATSSAAQWKIKSIDQLTSNLAVGDDVTFLLKGAPVSRNLYNSYDKVWYDANGSLTTLPTGGDNDNQNAERWGGNSTTFNYYQTISLPNGKYKVTVQGFYRYNNTTANTNDVAISTHAAGTEIINSVFYAGSESTPLKSIADDDAVTVLGGTSSIPFSQSAARAAFDKGLYVNELTVVVTDGQLTVGVKKETHPGCDWTVWDNFTITYLGSPTDLSTYVTSLNKAIETAKALSGKMNNDVASTLSSAISTYDGVTYETVDEYTAAIAAVTSATTAAQKSIKIYSGINDYAQKASSLDDAGKAAYETAAADVLTAYNAGTITDGTAELAAIKDAYILGVKAQTTPGSDITPAAPDTWEGATGSYGTRTERYNTYVYDGDVMTQTIEGLQPGTYTINLDASASYTSGRGFTGNTGDELTYIFGNKYQQSITVVDRGSTDDFGPYSFDVVVDGSGELVYGLTNVTPGANWFVINLNSITLKKIGVDYETLLNQTVAEAMTITDTMNGEIEEKLGTLESKYYVDGYKPSSDEEYQAAIDELENVMAEARASIKNYYAAGNYTAKGNSLDESGKAYYNADPTVAAISTALALKTFTELTDAQIASMDTAYISAVKAQTTSDTDMTDAIVNPSFETGDLTGWSVLLSDDTGAKSTSNSVYMMSDSEGNYLFNTWQSGYAITQTLTGMRPGKYTLSAVMATDAGQNLELYANSTSATAKSVDKGTGVRLSVNVTVTSGSLKITAGTKSSYWYKVDNFRLIFNEAVSYEDYYTQIDELVDSANNITERQSDEAKAALQEAINAATSASGVEKDLNKLQTVIANLESAITATLKSVAEYELGAVYNAAITGPGTVLADEEAALDNWTRSFTGTGTLGDWHRNTWSTEGDTDGSEMKTPFLENWVIDGQNLSDASFEHLAAAGLTAGYYKVSVLGRVYNAAGVTPSGAAIFKVNDDYVNMIATGTATDNIKSDLIGCYGTYSIIVYVEQDGTIRPSISIAGANFNWISFKNYKVEYLGAAPTAITFDRGDMRIKRGDSVSLITTSVPNGSSTEYVWTSSDNNVATVDNGTITAIADGTAVITATSAVNPEVSASITITVAYPSEPLNAGFSISDDMQEENIASSSTANSLDVTEWTSNGGAAWCSSAVIKYNTAGQINGAAIPASDVKGNQDGALGISVGWGGTVTYSQRLMLPAGTYLITVDAYNANTATTAFSKVGFITENGDSYLSDRTSYPSGMWVKDKVAFTLTEQTIGDIQVGITADNTGSGSNAKVFFDNVKITPTTLLAIAQENKLDAIAELSPIGDDIFQYSQADINSAIAAVNAAESVEAVEAIELPAINLPSEDKAYMIVEPTSGNYLNVASDGVRLSKFSQELYFKATEGGYLLSNGTEYVAYAGSNTWSITGNAEGSALTFVSVGDAYTIKGANGYIGYDNNEAGSSLYGNKAATNWEIKDFVQSDFLIDGALAVASYETIVADRIAIDLSLDNPVTAIVNDGTIKGNSVTLNIEVPNNKWSFVMFPCNVPVSELKNSQENTQWQIRKYDASARANGDFDNAWVALTDESVMAACQGYIIQSRRGEEATSTFTFTTSDADALNNIFTNADFFVELHAYESAYAVNAGWNLVGNPYLAFYDKSKMDTTAPITVWDTQNETYATYTSDDDYALAPFQAFFIQTTENVSINFDKAGRQTTNVISHDPGAKARIASANREIVNLSITDGTFTDKTRVAFEDNASLNYEIGRDAAKFMSSNTAVPQIYTKDASANYSVNVRPMADGAIRLGAYFGHDGQYTISVANVASAVVLEDMLTGENVVLGNGTDSYTFSATAGTADSRFVLYVGTEATKIAAVNAEGETSDGICTLQGVKVNKSAAKHGVYIVNGKKIMMK